MRLVQAPKRHQQPNQNQMRDSMSSVDVSRNSSIGLNETSSPDVPEFGGDVYKPSPVKTRRVLPPKTPATVLDDDSKELDLPDHYNTTTIDLASSSKVGIKKPINERDSVQPCGACCTKAACNMF